MRLLVLFLCILNFIYGKITKQMILNANKKIFKNNKLDMTILNPFFGYVYKNTNMLLDLRQFYHGINPIYKDIIRRDYTKDRSTDIFSKILIKLFPSSDENLSVNDRIAQKYFSKQESKSKNIKVVSRLVAYLLKKDTIFFPEEQKEVTRSNMVLILNKMINVLFTKRKIIKKQALGSFQDEFDSIYDEVIAVKEDTRSDIILTLHAFMLEVLDTEEEIIEYVKNILNKFIKKEKKILRASDIYALKLNKGEANFNDKSLLSKLSCIPDKHCLRRFYDAPSKGNFIPYYNRSEDRFDESYKFEDSVEIALLYLCNFLFYNEEKEQFDVEHLKLDDDSDLLKFYTKYKTPFYINNITRNEWSKVLQCLDDIDCSGLYNKNLGIIYYINKSARNKLEPSIFNIITVLTRICISSRNKIKAKYVELFNASYKYYDISCSFQIFIQLLVNKDINIKCRFENKRIEKNKLYANFFITSSPKKDERLKTDIIVCLQPQLCKNLFSHEYSYAEFQYDKPFISKELPKTLYVIYKCDKLTSLKCLIGRYVSYLDRNFSYKPNTKIYGFFGENVFINYFSKENYLYYLFYNLDNTEQNDEIFNIVKMVVKFALKDKNERYSDLRPFYIKIDDLKNNLSPKEIFEIWINLLYKSNLFESDYLLKLWTEEVKKITVPKECNLSRFLDIKKIYFALDTLKDKNVEKLEIALENLSTNFSIDDISILQDYRYLKELRFKNINFNYSYSQIEKLCDFLLTKKIISLELSNCDLTDSSVKIIAETISNENNNLKNLNIEKNMITPGGAMFLAKALESKNNKLVSLNISKNWIRIVGANYIIDALKRRTCNISSLNIGENEFTFEIILSKLKVVLFEINSNLQPLDLSNTYFNEKDIQIISESFELYKNDLCSLQMSSYYKTPAFKISHLSRDTALQNLCNAIKVEGNKLQNLDISSCEVTFEGIKFIADALKNEYNNLKSLNLSMNDFNEECANLIADSIANKNCKLETLDLCFCNTFIEDFKRIFEVIFEGKTNIKVLKIKQSNSNSRSYDYVIELIQKYGKKIVSISHDKISNYEYTIKVCCFISKNQKITFVV